MSGIYKIGKNNYQRLWRLNHPNYMRIHNKKYQQSKKGKLVLKRIHKFHKPIQYLKNKNLLILENCAICNSNKNIELHHPNPEMTLHIYFLCKSCHYIQHKEKR
jgi:hypothetical protein